MRPSHFHRAAAAAGIFSILAQGPAFAVCQMPLSVVSSGSGANVMILFDNSASMNEAIYHDDYDPAVTYSGQFDKDETYKVSSDGNYTPRSFNSIWPAAPTAYLVNSDAGEDGWYSGNYMNWVFFAANTTQRAAIPRVTRVQVAKQAVNAFVASAPGNRYGVMVFNDDDGGTLISAMGTATASVQTQVNGIAATAYTPLAETLVDILDYYKTTGAGAPIQNECQKSFVVIVSDGHPTKDLNVPTYLQDADGDGQDPGDCTSIGAPYSDSYDCSGYLDDVAYWMSRNDLRTDLTGTQNVETYVIGFNINAPILQNAAVEGGGQFFFANNASQLSSSLSAALNDITAKVSASSSVSVVAAENSASNRLYRARFETATWRGFVEACNLPYTTGATPVWEAGNILAGRDPATRTIFTSTTGTNKVDFVAGSATTLTTPLGAVDAAAATNLINYTRGTDITGTRDRAGWKLGDVVDAAPVAVGKPKRYHNYLAYAAYQSANATRTEMIYVAANDGMLHAFQASNGAENWAYIPKNQLPRLSLLMDPAYCHNFFLNLTPVVHDIYVGGAWKTVLIGGNERGGSGLFALNVTNPAAGSVTPMWDVDIASLKGSWNRPELVRDRNRNAHVLAVGTGYDSTSGQGSLLMLDPANGSVLATFNLGSVAVPNMVTAPVAIDKDFDGYDDLLYVGDLAGRIWRVNLTVNPWTITQLWSGTQPIQAAPVLSMNAAGNVLLFFGTGRYLNPSDFSTTVSQSLYGITDNNSGTTISRTNLVNQTSTINPIGSSRGWYIDLNQASGERIIRTAALVGGVLYVPSFKPNVTACRSGGDSWLYAVDFEDGSQSDASNGTERNVTTNRVTSMGDGILSNPSVDIVNDDILLQSSNATMVSQNIDATLKKLVVRSWRQVWNR